MDAALQVLRKKPTTMAALGRFGPFKPESERGIRTADVKTNQAIERMKKAWAECNYKAFYENNYYGMLDIVKSLRYSGKDVETFSLALNEFQNEKHFSEMAGLFLTALMNGSKDTDFVIHTSHIANHIDLIGYQNTKNITVDGDAGAHVGSSMKGGTITVGGNAGDEVGREMNWGSITVNGNAGIRVGDAMRAGMITIWGDADDSVGFRMKSGTLTVNGDAGEAVGYCMLGGAIIVGKNAGVHVGYWMNGGKIRIDGDYKSIAETVEHGKIFHKGVLIVDK